MSRLENEMGCKTDERVHFDAGRFFRITLHHGPRSGWYYQAREGTFGPFATQGQAERDLSRLVDKNPHQRLEIYRKLGLEVSKL